MEAIKNSIYPVIEEVIIKREGKIFVAANNQWPIANRPQVVLSN